MSTFQNTTVRSDESTHPLAGLLKIALDTTISVEARLLYVILVLMAWTKGRCWPSQAYQARALGRSDRSIRGYHHELEKAGLLIIERNPGSVNHYRPSILVDTQWGTSEVHCRRAPEVGCRITPKPELQNVRNVVVPPPRYVPPTTSPSQEPENVNALIFPAQEQVPDPIPNTIPRQTASPHRPSSQIAALTTDQLFLVEEIERCTGDTWSNKHFSNLVRQYDEQTIYAALSVTREKLTLESGVNGGAYFTATLRGMAHLQTMGSYHTTTYGETRHDELRKTFNPRHFHRNSEPITVYAHAAPKPTVASAPSKPQESIDPELVAPESLINGLKFSYKSGGVKSMLLWPVNLWLKSIRKRYGGRSRSC